MRRFAEDFKLLYRVAPYSVWWFVVVLLWMALRWPLPPLYEDPVNQIGIFCLMLMSLSLAFSARLLATAESAMSLGMPNIKLIFSRLVLKALVVTIVPSLWLLQGIGYNFSYAFTISLLSVSFGVFCSLTIFWVAFFFWAGVFGFSLYPPGSYEIIPIYIFVGIFIINIANIILFRWGRLSRIKWWKKGWEIAWLAEQRRDYKSSYFKDRGWDWVAPRAREKTRRTPVHNMSYGLGPDIFLGITSYLVLSFLGLIAGFSVFLFSGFIGLDERSNNIIFLVLMNSTFIISWPYYSENASKLMRIDCGALSLMPGLGSGRQQNMVFNLLLLKAAAKLVLPFMIIGWLLFYAMEWPYFIVSFLITVTAIPCCLFYFLRKTRQGCADRIGIGLWLLFWLSIVVSIPIASNPSNPFYFTTLPFWVAWLCAAVTLYWVEWRRFSRRPHPWLIETDGRGARMFS